MARTVEEGVVIAGTPWHEWPAQDRAKLEALARRVPCDWHRVQAHETCSDGMSFPYLGGITEYVCPMRCARAFFRLPDEERETWAVVVKLRASV